MIPSVGELGEDPQRKPRASGDDPFVMDDDADILR